MNNAARRQTCFRGIYSLSKMVGHSLFIACIVFVCFFFYQDWDILGTRLELVPIGVNTNNNDNTRNSNDESGNNHNNNNST